MSYKKHITKVVGVAVVVLVGIGMVLLISHFMDSTPGKPQKKVQQITLVTPPPPPPPPPKQERPPEPEIQEEVEIPEDQPLEEMPEMADEPPAGDLLGLDAEGGAGSDGFGLVGRKGGRGLLAGAGDPRVIYATQLQRLIEDALAESEDIRSRNYSVVCKVWVGRDGSVLRAELATSTGETDIDASLVDIIGALPSLAEAPPDDMRQPIRLRISSRL